MSRSFSAAATVAPAAERPARAARHIGMVTETYPPEINGVALSLARLVSGLRGRGHRVSLVRPRQPLVDGPSGGRSPDETVVAGLPLPGYAEVRFGLPFAGQIRERWRQDPPDVVYVATEGPLGWAARRAAHRLRVPVFSGFHTNFHGYARHYGVGFMRPAILRYLRWFHNGTLGTIVATADVRQQLLGAGFDNLSVLGRGVDRELFAPARRSGALRSAWGVASGDLVALYVGRLAPEKNLSVAVDAYRAMQRTGGATRFVLVGDGPERAALAHAHPDLLFCGMQRGEALAAHYASGDVFLFPSETETFGNVTLEAMASGLAVVAYDYAGARMHVVHGASGLLAPRGDARAFVDVAAALGRSPQHARRMGAGAREQSARADWADVVDRFEAILTKGEPSC